MIYGNWVAIRKVFAKHLPMDRPYTKLEAVFSISLDFDSDNPASYSGYSKLWGWSRNKVKKFMDDLGISILKPATSEELRLQKGKLKGHPKGHPQDTLENEKGHPNFVYNKDLYEVKDNHKGKKGQPKDNLKGTTIDPNKILNPNKELIVSVVDYLNQKLGTNYKPSTDKTKSCINARANEGNQLEQFKTVIDKKYNQWFGTDDAKYLRPETLFGTKFEGYLNQLNGSKSQTVEKLSIEKFKEAIQYKKDNQIEGKRFQFNEDSLNKIIKKHPFIDDEKFESKTFDIIYKEYLKL